MSSISPTDPQAPERPSRLRLTLARTVFVAVCLLTLLVALFVEERIRGRLNWQAYEKDARQRGVKMDFTDFIPPKIPDAENFASIPLFDEAFRAADSRQNYIPPLALPKTEQAPKTLPNLSDLAQQRRVDFTAWQKYFVTAKFLPAAGENAAADTLRALHKYDADLAQLREAAKRPHCRFPVHWERGFEAGLPHLAVLMNAQKILALRLAAHLELGQSAEAYEDFQLSLRLITLTSHEPTLINGLVRIAGLGLLINPVWAGLSAHQWAEPELRKIEADLATVNWLEGYESAMGSERAAMNYMLDYMIGSPSKLGRVMGLVQITGAQQPGEKNWVWWLYPTGWLYQNQLRMNRYFDENLARVDSTQQRYFIERPVLSSPANVQALPKKFYYLFFAIAAPALESVEKRYVWAGTVTTEARLACALERYRLARGTFPNALAELSPEFLQSEPHEILNGEPYHYRRTAEGGYALYSVALNLKDDGGVPGPEKNTNGQLDWVWQVSGQ